MSVSRQEDHLATSCRLLLVSNQVPKRWYLGAGERDETQGSLGLLMSGLREQGNRISSRT